RPPRRWRGRRRRRSASFESRCSSLLVLLAFPQADGEADSVTGQDREGDAVGSPDEFPAPGDHAGHRSPPAASAVDAAGGGASSAARRLRAIWLRRVTKAISTKSMPKALMRSGVTMALSTVCGVDCT